MQTNAKEDIGESRYLPPTKRF